MPRPHYKSYTGITSLARDLRNNQTPSEIILWNILRRRKLSSYKFLRQHPIFYRVNKKWVEFFIADFYCAKLKMIIEVDGKIHEKQKEYDNERDSKLFEKGISVIRIKNEEVNDTKNITATLSQIINERARQLTEIAPLPLLFKGRAGGRVKKNTYP
jgi:very-short-patch-repair endonuclease